MGCEQSCTRQAKRASKNDIPSQICATNASCEDCTDVLACKNHQTMKDSPIHESKCEQNNDDGVILNSARTRSSSSRYKLTPRTLKSYPTNRRTLSQSPHSCTTSHSAVNTFGPSPKEPYEKGDGNSQFTNVNNVATAPRLKSDDDGEDSDSLLSNVSNNSSTPQLCYIGPTCRAEQRDGTWEWWYEQVEQLRITKDYMCRTKLQDIPNRLARQYEVDKGQVELDMGWCYMERSAPYVIGRLFASPFLNAIRWVTALRLDGNYFTDEGFGNMLAVLCEANRSRPALPLLRHLYLNNMNLDPCSIKGILFYLFPTDPNRRHPKIAGEAVTPPSDAYMPFGIVPKAPLFPSLEVLSLCDNPGIGDQGLAELLRSLIAFHFEGHYLSVVDLSRCAVDEIGVQYLREYLALVSNMVQHEESIVFVRRFVLIGNRHSIDRNNEMCSTEDVTLVL